MKAIRKHLSSLGIGAVLASAGSFIAVHEGYVPGAYIDPVGIKSACFGHTGSNIDQKATISESRCLTLLAKDLNEHNEQLERAVNQPLSTQEHVAYLSFHYNVGAGNFNNSTLLKKLNAGHRIEACKELSRWVYANGIKLPGLVTRRARERSLCLKGVPSYVR